MNQEQLDMERFKIQKTQMYLQVMSVIMSGILLYVLINGKKQTAAIQEQLSEIEED